ncbi:uncharacterized protein ZMO1_ZMO0877 [Zymomonas mobilis subsp. mobilis ZM4 = ATCC 31821]|uniref:Uncharacterized protein n=2 Tax=Zymomonas mobilis subsp. mobilis TaxID=120045 RepID=Q5NP59_ZYMMO|nr:hypothetical protein [Zymomonas mobilis]AAV89501.1 hypothetical protein ZMO0877 [Zymomonas mobilis subsp. mobilis ZM4 = ATCC 31821]ACV74965.1 hypothetical protein Za10_0415 [Zymomonas mobilis subsp. mobilis NCIMB 11163]AEH62267.1 conserved hypothetical protein [Zymomonas mobilis subsp. mobilis ATCC 10988]AHB09751.1 hypothetical protein ZCP4_0434 [Zymomonas mobilis subsp. mobilis str. CP4 = NRRL B-14023]AHJ70056.1 hypothetical protein A254_00429 [Zymomonas mobilis subsp. mobilis NRRL B-12526
MSEIKSDKDFLNPEQARPCSGDLCKNNRATTLLFKKLAAEVALVRHDVEHLSVILCGDSYVVENHVSVLQDFDHITQRLAIIADILQADDRLEAVKHIPLEVLAARLNNK